MPYASTGSGRFRGQGVDSLPLPKGSGNPSEIKAAWEWRSFETEILKENVCHYCRRLAYTAFATISTETWNPNMHKLIRFTSTVAAYCACAAILAWSTAATAQAQPEKIVIPRGDSTIVLEPYAPNVIRVTLSLEKDQAIAPPGYGIVAKPANQGWEYEETPDAHIYRSSRMTVTLLGGSGRHGATGLVHARRDVVRHGMAFSSRGNLTGVTVSSYPQRRAERITAPSR